MNFWELRFGNVVGIVDTYGAVHSRFTKDIENHSLYWPATNCVKWRWSFNQGIWWILDGNAPNEEEFVSIQNHLSRKYGLKWWTNGHHDIDHFIAKMERDKKKRCACNLTMSDNGKVTGVEHFWKCGQPATHILKGDPLHPQGLRLCARHAAAKARSTRAKSGATTIEKI